VTSPATTEKGNIAWNAADYAANSTVQQTWARELIAKLHLRGDERILDVGCGDGKITAELACAVPEGEVTGIDASPQMVEFARGAFPNLKFQVMDARRIYFDQPFDLILSNAALHWVDDHEAFLRGAASALRPGGRLVVSCGGKGNAQDVFRALCPVMRMKRWREFFRRLEPPYFFYSPDDYRNWLPQSGFEIRDVRLAPKDAIYQGREDFAAWLRTTWLPYVQRVPEAVAQASCLSNSVLLKERAGKMPAPLSNLREEFIAAVVERYVARHPLDADGCVHVRMVRLEIDAIKI